MTVTGDPVKGCVWLGDPVRRYMAVWYPGWWARFNPVRIYDARGEQVWSELDPPRDIGGGWFEWLVERIAEQCRVGTSAWWVVPPNQ